MILRDVEPGDLHAYVRMRCDPDMMAELGGSLPREGMEDKVRRDVESVASDTSWIKMIIPDGAGSGVVAGSLALWSHDSHGEMLSEIGWMVLPEFQGRRLASRGVRMLLELARDDVRWGPLHAFPAVTNGPSNGICRSVGFTLLGEREVEFAGKIFRSNHWVIDPATDPDLAGS